MKIRTAAMALPALAVLAGCASHAAPASAAAPAAAGSPAVAQTARSEPVTAAAARAAAVAYFGLYAARQYPATYAMLAPAARKVISEGTWAQAHAKCATAARLAYKVGRPVLAGDTAVVSVALAGAPAAGAPAAGGAAKGARERQSMTYSGGEWWYSPSDLAVYQGHSAAQAEAMLKAAGNCG